MKPVFYLVLVVALVAIAHAQKPLDQEKIKQMEALLNNENYVKSVFRCLLEKGPRPPPCDSNAKKIKNNLTRGVAIRACPAELCTPEEQHFAPIVEQKIRNQYPDKYIEIMKAYNIPDSATLGPVPAAPAA